MRNRKPCSGAVLAIVEFAERTDAVEPVDIDEIGEAGMFFFDLPPQRPQEIGMYGAREGSERTSAAPSMSHGTETATARLLVKG